jgi:hypothetical protein
MEDDLQILSLRRNEVGIDASIVGVLRRDSSRRGDSEGNC